MKRFVLHDASVIFPYSISEHTSVIVEDGIIADICPSDNVDANEEIINCTGLYLSPGFVDIHVHGGGGYDFMDGTEEAIRGAINAHMKHGTTTIVPTTLTADDYDLASMFDAMRDICLSEKDAQTIPYIPGVHLEGPYISPEMAGAQDPKYIRKPTEDDWLRIFMMSHGLIKIWTVAPELRGAISLCKRLRKEGVVFSAGHSSAKYSDVLSAIKAGYSMATHLYSSMSTITRENGYRVPGLLEAALLHDEITAEIIADGKHLPAPLLKLVVKTKGVDKIVLVTDAMRGAGMPDGEYMLGSLKGGQLVKVFDGIAHMPDGISFAGSVATCDRLVRVMLNDAEVPLSEAVRMMTLNPSRELGIDKRKGSVEKGKEADIVLFDDNIEIEKVFLRGKQSYDIEF